VSDGREHEIEWADHTINFWWGCEKVSPGCKNCYADATAHRVGDDVWGKYKPRRWVRSAAQLADKLDKKAAKLGVRYRVFANSMSDFFEDDYGQSIIYTNGKDKELRHACAWYRDDIGPVTAGGTTINHSRGERRCTLTDLRMHAYSVIESTPNLDWIIVTKRPENIPGMWPQHVDSHEDQCSGSLPRYLRNVWLLTSVESQRQISRILHLRASRDISPVLGCPASHCSESWTCPITCSTSIG
jgi:protein gp37